MVDMVEKKAISYNQSEAVGWVTISGEENKLWLTGLKTIPLMLSIE